MKYEHQRTLERVQSIDGAYSWSKIPINYRSKFCQVFGGALREMTTSNEIKTNNPPVAASVENTKKDSDKNADDLDGLENKFRNAVKIASVDVVSSVKSDDELGTTLPMSSTTSPDNINNIESKDVPMTPLLDILNVSKSLRRIASLINDAKNILILSGAGVSVAAGIPDFRTPGTGLYDNLQKYDLPYAEAVFDIQYYQMNPKPFIQLAAELWPDHHVPTITHSFIALLADKQRLSRNYTQVRF